MIATVFLLVSLAFGASLTRWIGIRLNIFEFAAFSALLGLFSMAWIMLLPSMPLPYAASLPIGFVAMVAFGVKLWILGSPIRFAIISNHTMIAWSVLAGLAAVFWFSLSYTHDLRPVDGALQSVGSTWADFGLHANIVTHQAFSTYLPGDLPVASGTNLTYPFLVDYVSALFLREGWSLHMALTIPGTLLAWALTLLVVGFGKRLFGNLGGAMIGLVLTLCAGSFIGITLAWQSYQDSGQSIFGWLGEVPDNFAGNWAHSAQFFNPVADLLLPQRAFLFGLGIFLVAAILWHRVFVGADLADEDDAAPPVTRPKKAAPGKAASSKAASSKAASGKAGSGKPGTGKPGTGKAAKARVRTERPAKNVPAPDLDVQAEPAASGWLVATLADWMPATQVARRGLLTGAVLFGLMPMTHAHSFVALGALYVGLFVAVLVQRRHEWKPWAFALAVAFVLALPQVAWQWFGVPNGTGGHFSRGWSRQPGDPLLDYEWRNFGFFLLILVGIGAVLATKRWAQYRPWLIPFVVLFFFAQIYSLQPLDYDNLKLFFYVYLMMMLALGALIAMLPTWGRPVAVFVAVCCLSLGGAATIVREFQLRYTFATADDIALANWVKANTKTTDVFAGIPGVGEAPGTIGGRVLLMAYSGWLVNYNLDGAPREAAIRALLQGQTNDPNVEKYKPDYLFVPSYDDPQWPANREALASLNKIYGNSTWSVYKLKEDKK